MRRQYLRNAVAVFGAVIVICGAPRIATAMDVQDPGLIQAAVESAFAPRATAFGNARIEVSVAQIDSRLNLPACPNLQVSLPPTAGAVVSAKVSCDMPHWTLYVPVRLHAWVDAVVAAANLAPNRALTARDLTRAPVDQLSGGSGFFTDPAQVEGKILRVGLMAGAPILSPQVDLPVSVHRGQKVLLTLSDPSMTLRATAVALEDGRVGDDIAVQNPDSQKTLHATVTPNGGVELKF